LDERCIPISLKEVRHPTGQPIVPVNDIVARAGTKTVKSDFVCKIREEIEELVLVDWRRRPGGYINYGDVITYLNRVWGVWISTTGENVDRNSELAGITGKLADVDVHAARVAAAKRGQR
jgi:hypothetical protein